MPEEAAPVPTAVESPNLAFYRANYKGMTRGELAQRDNALYQRLRKEGLLEQVPTANRIIKNAIAFYRANYRGMMRGELKRTDESLYRRLRREKKLGQIPKRNGKSH